MSETKFTARVCDLRGQITAHDMRYYSEGKPTVTDQEYDALMRELQDLETQHPELITPSSPTQRVGAEVSKGFTKGRHSQPMLSISNVFNDEELRKFVESCEQASATPYPTFCVEPKFDGLAVAVRYIGGTLSLALTRGDGNEGDDVTVNMRTIRNLPLVLSRPIDIELRGEVYMSRAVFARLNAQREADGEELFSNPRNAAVGALKSLDPKQAAERELSVVFYQALNTDMREALAKHSAMLMLLETLGLPTSKRYSCLCFNLDDVRRAIHDVQLARDIYPFDTDGAVIKVNETSLRENLGAGSKSPKWAAAFKFPPAQATTRVVAVDFQIGRTGALTPVARLNPVLLSGSLVRNATLHNFSEIARKDIRIGDLVIIEKAGEIIPAVRSVVKESRTGAEIEIAVPVKCPFCNGMVVTVADMAAALCINRTCPGKARRVLAYFCSKDIMNLKGIGPGVLAILEASNVVKVPRDLYMLTADQLAGLPGIARTKATAIMVAINNSRAQPAWRLLASLGIPGVGTTLSPKLLEVFGSIEKLAGAKVDELTALDGVGDIMARDIVEWFGPFENQNYLLGLKACGLQTASEVVAAKSDKLAGTKWVITGSLSRPREAFEAIIKAHGGAVSSSVSKKTSFLLCGSEPGSKLTKAESLKVPVLVEAAFMEMIT
jgi:DNA ligase (NAD+)